MTRPSSRLVLPDGTSYEGTLQLDGDGQLVVRMATCGVCGFSWNDALVTEITPIPAGRCPNEYSHPIAHDKAGGRLVTAKDYKILAGALYEAREQALYNGHFTVAGVNLATNAIAAALKANNPRFDEGTFYAAARGEA